MLGLCSSRNPYSFYDHEYLRDIFVNQKMKEMSAHQLPHHLFRTPSAISATLYLSPDKETAVKIVIFQYRGISHIRAVIRVLGTSVALESSRSLSNVCSNHSFNPREALTPGPQHPSNPSLPTHLPPLALPLLRRILSTRSNSSNMTFSLLRFVSFVVDFLLYIVLLDK